MSGLPLLNDKLEKFLNLLVMCTNIIYNNCNFVFLNHGTEEEGSLYLLVYT